MEMIHKRLVAFRVFQELSAKGYAIPKLDPSESNRQLWSNTYNNYLLQLTEANKLVIPLLVIWTTTACTLNCKYCGNYIPFLRKNNINYRYEFKDFKSDIDKLMKSIDGVIQLIFAGGGGAIINQELFIFYKRILFVSTHRKNYNYYKWYGYSW